MNVARVQAPLADKYAYIEHNVCLPFLALESSPTATDNFCILL